MHVIGQRGELRGFGPATVIFDPAVHPDLDSALFDEPAWHADPSHEHSMTGRGRVKLLDVGNETWVRRHYFRGGFVSRLISDHYLWTGIDRARPVREWRLLHYLYSLGLPVPRPVAGRVIRTGPLYQGDLITVLLPHTRPLSREIATGSVDASIWSLIGTMLRRFHDAGVDHPDLTAHNILIDGRGGVWLLDFDSAFVRTGSDWKAARMRRLNRSLNKVALETGTRFDAEGWALLVDAYDTAP